MQVKTAGFSIAASQDIAIGVALAMHAVGMEPSMIHPSVWAFVPFPPNTITRVLPQYTTGQFTTGVRAAGILADRKLAFVIGVGKAICVAGMRFELTLRSAALLKLSPKLITTFVSSLQGLNKLRVAVKQCLQQWHRPHLQQVHQHPCQRGIGFVIFRLPCTLESTPREPKVSQGRSHG